MADPGTTTTSGTEEQYHTGRVVMLAVVAALGGFMFGFDTAVINGAVTAVREDFAMSSGLTGFVVASALLGAALGAWGAGPARRPLRPHPRDGRSPPCCSSSARSAPASPPGRSA